jgi:hypothetical protein
MIKPGRMKWKGYVVRMRNTNRILVGKPKGIRRIGRTNGRWEDNIEIDPKEIGWKIVDWIHLAQDRD